MKKLFVIAAIVLGTAAFSACGGKTEGDGTTDTTATETMMSTDTASTMSADTAAADSAR